MPEYFDIYDIHRTRTGRIHERGTPLPEGAYTLVVHLLLFDEAGKLLVQKRVPDKSGWPDMWDISLGGHVQAGETSAQGIAREAQEELGITLDFSDSAPILSVRTGNVFDDYWTAQIPSDTPLRLQSEEVADARWVDRREWAEMLAKRQIIPYTFQALLFDMYDAGFPGTHVFPFGDPAEIRGAVFDMDGLLLDTERVVSRSWDAGAREFGLRDVERAKRACMGLNEAGTKAYFVRTYGEDFPFDAFRSFTRRLSHEVLDKEVPVKPGASALLQMLKERGIALAVASSTREVTVRDQLDRGGLLSFFDAVITGDMVENGKPHPEIFSKACRALGLPPEKCLAFEDSVNGIRSAYRAGTYPIHIPDLVPPNLETQTLSWKCFASLTEAAAFLAQR